MGKEFLDNFIGDNPFSLRYLKHHFVKDDVKYTDILVNSFKEAIRLLVEKYGKKQKKWAWGNIHKITLEHPFAMADDSAKIFSIGPYPVGGDRNTLNNGHYSPVDDYKMVAGPSLRQILIPENWDRSLMCIPGGQYGLQFHKHYKDLMDYWVNGTYFPYLFSKEAIEGDLEEKLIYLP